MSTGSRRESVTVAKRQPQQLFLKSTFSSSEVVKTIGYLVSIYMPQRNQLFIKIGRVSACFIRSLIYRHYKSSALPPRHCSAPNTVSTPYSSFMTSRKNNSALRSQSSVSDGNETAPSDGTLRPSESEDDLSNSDKDDALDSLQNQIESLKIVDSSPEEARKQKDDEWRQNLPESVKKLGMWIQEAENILVLTGAGISVSAGIPDFRTPGCGLVSFLFYDFSVADESMRTDIFLLLPVVRQSSKVQSPLSGSSF